MKKLVSVSRVRHLYFYLFKWLFRLKTDDKHHRLKQELR